MWSLYLCLCLDEVLATGLRKSQNWKESEGSHDDS